MKMSGVVRLAKLIGDSCGLPLSFSGADGDLFTDGKRFVYVATRFETEGDSITVLSGSGSGAKVEDRLTAPIQLHGYDEVMAYLEAVQELDILRREAADVADRLEAAIAVVKSFGSV